MSTAAHASIPIAGTLRRRFEAGHGGACPAAASPIPFEAHQHSIAELPVAVSGLNDPSRSTFLSPKRLLLTASPLLASAKSS